MKRKKRIRFDKATLIFCLVNILLLLYWIWMFYMTQTATSANTYQTNEVIVDVKIHPFIHRGTSKIYLYTNDNRYMIEAAKRTNDECYDLADKILSSDEKLTLTVWEHVPKSIFHSSHNMLKVKQIVVLQIGNEIYFDIPEHNEYQKEQRIYGVIAGIFLTVTIVPFSVLMWEVTRKKFRGKSALRKAAKRKAVGRKRLEEKWSSIIKRFNRTQ